MIHQYSLVLGIFQGEWKARPDSPGGTRHQEFICLCWVIHLHESATDSSLPYLDVESEKKTSIKLATARAQFSSLW